MVDLVVGIVMLRSGAWLAELRRVERDLHECKVHF
jgi:hypothetical protein